MTCLNNLTVYVKQHGTKSEFNKKDSWVILSPIEQSIKRKIEAVGTPLKDWDISINYGIKTGFNDAFIISGEKKDELIAKDPKSAEIIHPILRGRDIKRYGYNFADLWLINTHNGIKEKNIPPIDVNDYPAIKEHLDQYYPKLAKRADKGITPYNLRNCAYIQDFFNGDKIMYNDICQRLSFSIVPQNIFCANTVYFIKNNSHIYYLSACLNSSLINWYYRTLSVQLGEKAVRMFSIYVQNIPVPKINLYEENKIKELVIEYIVQNDENKKNQINDKLELIFLNLYNLTEEEKKFILSES